VKREHTGNSTTCRSNRRGILVLAPNWLGDAVMATPFLFALRNAYPEWNTYLLCRRYVSAIYRHCSAVDCLVDYERNMGLRGALRALGSGVPKEMREICFVLPVSFRSALISFLAGAKRRVGYGGDFRSMLFTDALPSRSYRSLHVVEAYIGLLRRVFGGVDGQSPMPVVVPSYEWEKDLESFGLEEGYIVLSPGAEYGGAKVWPPARFKRVAAMVSKKTGRRIVVVGSKGEELAADEILENTGAGRNLAGRCSVDELLSVLRGASLVIGNDSGPAHMAAAMGRPTVAIFGSTSPSWTAPRGRAVEIVTADVECSPCFERECPHGEPRCMMEIEPQLVFEKACRLLGEVCREGAN
jgi:heptosyltransferase-2